MTASDRQIVPGAIEARPLDFRRRAGFWVAYAMPELPLIIRCMAVGYVFRGIAHPDYPTAVAAANAWWAAEVRRALVINDTQRRAA